MADIVKVISDYDSGACGIVDILRATPAVVKTHPQHLHTEDICFEAECGVVSCLQSTDTTGPLRQTKYCCDD